jgi:exonuclease III
MTDTPATNPTPYGPTLSILQLNCGNANHSLHRGLLDSLNPEEFPILAIQEPYFNQHTKTTYCPRAYHLLYQPEEKTRVCFFVNKAMALDSWEHKHLSLDASLLLIKTSAGPIAITNIYNPRQKGQPTLSCREEVIQATENNSAHQILLGDLNLHHPQWGGPYVHAEAPAEELLEITAAGGLRVATPTGAITWQRMPSSQSTIDLTFISEGLYQRLLKCQPQPSMTLGWDHIPIITQLDLEIHTQPPPNRFRIKEIEKTRTKAEIKDGLAQLRPFNAETAAPQDVDQRLEEIQTVILKALQNNCQKTKPSPYAKPGWSEDCTNLLRIHRRARTEYSNNPSPEAAISYRHCRNRLKRAIRTGNRKSWRLFLEKLSLRPEQPHNQEMWRLSKWSRNKAGRPVEDPHLPPLRKSPDDPLITDNEGKAKLLISQFYPPPPEADLSDIPNDTSTLPRFTIPQDFPDTLLERELEKLPNGKAPGPDRIANEVLKEAHKELAPYLAEAFTAAAHLGYYPKIGKSTTTVALRKDGKADYSLTNSYRPIALENTIAKVYEKLLATLISQEAEERGLLPPTQMGARPKRSTLSALELIDETVRTAWKGKRKNENIVSMLSLDISGAYPNTSHKRLLYILQQKGFPEWVVQVTRGFIEGQTTRLVAGGLVSQEVEIKTGIPQGSPLSPILFLLFSSELLEILESRDTRGSAFVDDTNILTVSPSVAVNCRRLEEAHNKCLAWARKHGVKFAPDKYQLIYFTRRRHKLGLDHPIHI